MNKNNFLPQVFGSWLLVGSTIGFVVMATLITISIYRFDSCMIEYEKDLQELYWKIQEYKSKYDTTFKNDFEDVPIEDFGVV